MPARLLLGLAVVALGGIILYTSTGQLSHVVAGVGSELAGVVSGLTASTEPTASVAPISGSPTLIPPQEYYTNKPLVTLTGAIPTDMVGRTDLRIRIYRAVGDGQPVLVRELQLGSTASFTVPNVIIEHGSNYFTATLAGPAGESQPSASVRYVLDTSNPKITITSPKDGATVNASSVQIVGNTQQRTVVVARNEANGASATGKASGTDGVFTINLGLEPGPNGITVTGTDPAGNTGQAIISVLRGDGKLTASLTPSAYQFAAKSLPDPLTLTALVTDPNGHPLGGASVTFTVSIPGIQPITQDSSTDGSGSAIFRTTIPKGATPGNGLATVLVTTKQYGSVTARAVIVIK